VEQVRAEGQVAGAGGEGEGGFTLVEGHEQQVGVAGFVPEDASAVDPGGVIAKDAEAARLLRNRRRRRSLRRQSFGSEEKKAALGVGREGFDCLEIVQKQSRGSGIAGIPDAKADHLGWKSSAQNESKEVFVFGDQQIDVAAGKLPDLQIIRSTKPKQPHMLGIFKPCRQQR